MSTQTNTSNLQITERPRGGPFSIGQVMAEFLDDYEDALRREQGRDAA